MSNVLDHQKEVLGLGRLGWPVRRIAEATGVDRATAGDYLTVLSTVGVIVAASRQRGDARASPLGLALHLLHTRP